LTIWCPITIEQEASEEFKKCQTKWKHLWINGKSKNWYCWQTL